MPLIIIGLCLFPVLASGQSLGDQLERMDEKRLAGAFEEALAELQSLQSEHPNNAEILWRIARMRVDVGEDLEDPDRRKTLFLEAVEDAEAAIEADPENAEAHLSMAITAGRAGLVAGTRDKVRRSRAVKDHADRAIELDPENDLAYHVRARWNYEVANLGFVARNVVRVVYGGLPDASYEQAEEDMRMAISLRDRVVHRLELGRTLLQLGHEEEAREQFQAAIDLPSEDPNDTMYKQHAYDHIRRL